MDPSTVCRHKEGTALWAADRVLVGMRLPLTLPATVCQQLKRVHDEWRKRRPFLRRGKSCANVCVSFAFPTTSRLLPATLRATRRLL